MTAVVLHLSDIHIKTPKDPILKRGAAIAAATFVSLPAASHVFIICSGDVAYSGTEDEYQAASGLFAEIEAAIRKETDCPISFVMAPGNHDCDFDKNSAARRMLVEHMEKSDNPDIDNSVIETCVGVQEQFFRFRESLEKCSSTQDDKLWRSSSFEVEGKTLTFDCLNISWVSKVREDIGSLWLSD